MDPARQQRLDAIAAIAVKIEAETKLPAKLLVAQWAVESQWGSKPVGECNYFGIKRADRHAKFCTVPTQEVFTQAQVAAWNKAHPARPAKLLESLSDGRSRVQIDDEFADYDSLEDSARDYAWLITHGAPYAKAWAVFLADGNFTNLANDVLKVYATAQYGSLALQIAAQDNVASAIQSASGVNA